MIKYFGYGSNKDLDMMVHMVGRSDLKGTPGKLLGYELCLQSLEQIRDHKPLSPREIIRQGFGNEFLLFVAREKTGSEIHGTIWDLTPEEIELVKNWEMTELGMQEEIKAEAIDSDGNKITVETQAVINPPPQIESVVTDPNYDPYIVAKEKMLAVADRVREDFLKQSNKSN